MKWSAFSSHRLLSSKLQQKVVYKKSCLLMSYIPPCMPFSIDCPYRFQLISNKKKIKNLGHFLDFKEKIAREPLKLKRKSQGPGLSSGQVWCFKKACSNEFHSCALAHGNSFSFQKHVFCNGVSALLGFVWHFASRHWNIIKDLIHSPFKNALSTSGRREKDLFFPHIINTLWPRSRKLEAKKRLQVLDRRYLYS